MPQRNRCWFAARVVAVRQRWGLTIDAREANALEAVLSSCSTTELDAGGGDWSGSQQPSAFQTGSADAHAALGRQRERDDHVRRSAAERNRPGSPRAPRPFRSCGTATVTASCASGELPDTRVAGEGYSTPGGRDHHKPRGYPQPDHSTPSAGGAFHLFLIRHFRSPRDGVFMYVLMSRMSPMSRVIGFCPLVLVFSTILYSR